ncbi:hypothetical protein GOB94_13965 [Granulicella sp. 5B5]|nr:hypothetical protein [Granulicella sp. 5B5]QMV19672.1 hypothetical protein GOB94_13965 [Granulicella sp. 5B5]
MKEEFEKWFTRWWRGKPEGPGYRRCRALGWAMWQELKGEKESEEKRCE